MSRDKLEEVLDEALQYVIRVGDASSQLVNVAFLFGTNANESVSGRAHRLRNKSKGWNTLRAAINFAFDDNHCEQAYLKDVERAENTVKEAEQAKNS